MFKLKAKAFTLVELLVVIAIIGILATLAIVSIQSTRAKARDAKRVADIRQIQTALELYFNDNSSYPVSTSVTSSIRFGSRVYMEIYPQAPTPPDGVCDEDSNQYIYSEEGEDNGSYTLSFCLGRDIGNLSSGVQIASPLGIGSFVCGNRFDYQGYSYETVKIGEQCWFKEYLQYDNGCSSVTWVNNTDVGWCGWYQNDRNTYSSYGMLYQWSAAMDGSTSEGARGLCPPGWRLPIHDDWTTLEREICTSASCETDFPYNKTTYGWRGTNEGTRLRIGGTSGLDAKLPGFRWGSGGWYSQGFVFIWTSSWWSGWRGTNPWFRHFRYDRTTSGRDYDQSSSCAFSVLCILN